jgi:copper homeostasis protein
VARILEIIACSLEDALAAEAGGADRLEVCVGLADGGLTPPPALVEQILHRVRIPMRVMIRATDSYSITEEERQIVPFLRLPMEGLVCGFRDTAGQLDFAALDRVLRDAPRAWRLTFHRAFENAAGAPAAKFAALRAHGRADRVLIALGDQLRRVAALSDDRLRVIAGAGLDAENLPAWRAVPGCQEFHFGRAARTPPEPGAPVDERKVRRLRAILDRA